MEKCTKQILRDSNTEQKINFTQWEHNLIPKTPKQSFKPRENTETSMSYVM